MYAGWRVPMWWKMLVQRLVRSCGNFAVQMRQASRSMPNPCSTSSSREALKAMTTPMHIAVLAATADCVAQHNFAYKQSSISKINTCEASCLASGDG